MISVPECFSESYAEARPKFCSAAAEAGGALRSWLNPKARGPNGEALYLDTVRFGADDAPNMLVLIAGMDVLRFVPALVLTDAQIEEAVRILRRSVELFLKPV